MYVTTYKHTHTEIQKNMPVTYHTGVSSAGSGGLILEQLRVNHLTDRGATLFY